VRDGEEHTVEFVVMATGDNCATPTITTVLEIFGRSEDVSKFDLDSPSAEGRPFFKGNLEFLKNMSRTLHQQGQVKVVTFRKFRFTVEQHKDLRALKGLNVRFPECIFDDDNTPIPEDIESTLQRSTRRRRTRRRRTTRRPQHRIVVGVAFKLPKLNQVPLRLLSMILPAGVATRKSTRRNASAFYAT
jgi:hypothetical protein